VTKYSWWGQDWNNNRDAHRSPWYSDEVFLVRTGLKRTMGCLSDPSQYSDEVFLVRTGLKLKNLYLTAPVLLSDEVFLVRTGLKQ